MSILKFPLKWFDKSVTTAPAKLFVPSTYIIRSYADDIDKHGMPLDSGLPDYFRRVAAYYEATND